MRERLKYWWTALYLPIYLICFWYLENRPVDVHIISIPLDHQIPFLEIFVIPYFLWFPFMAAAFVGLFFLDKKEYIKMASFLISGMTLFLIISFFYPNGLDLRPEVMPRDNLFTRMVLNLYGTDTSTNVFPSLHVFNSIGAGIAFWRYGKKIQEKKKNKANYIGITAIVLAALIILSTMFIKQHSIVDVIGAFLMAVILYFIVYILCYVPEKYDIGCVPSNLWYHIFGEVILVTIISWFTGIRVKPDKDYLNEEGPIIVISNHESYLDPMVVSKLTRGRPVNFVCGEFLFRLHFWGHAFKLGGAIPKKQFVVDAVSVKAMMKVLKRKGCLLVFPEATRSVDGSTVNFDDGIAKMAKKAKAAIYIAHIHGAYSAMPRWSKGIRRGKITAEFVRKLPASKTAEMTDEELQNYIIDGINYDENEYQREHKLTYKGKNLAQGLQNIAYKCPKCNSDFTMKWQGKADGNSIACESCGNKATMNVYGLLEKDTDDNVIFDDLKKWTTWEREEVLKELQNDDFYMTFSAELFKVYDDFTFANTGNGKITITSTEIIYEGGDCDSKSGIPYRKGKIVKGFENRSLEGVSSLVKRVFEIKNMRGMVCKYGQYFEIYDSKGELFRFHVDGQKVYKVQLAVQLLGKF